MGANKKHNENDYRALALVLARIKKISPIKARYLYDGEESINPAYTDIDHCEPLCPNEKRIFVLRSDLILATGIKNVCVYEGNTDIYQKTDPSVHEYINSKDRYGHPSLAQSDDQYDGGVYYAGWLCQRKGHIKVFLQSGRFHHPNLTDLEKMDIELYVSYQFMQAYGKQEIHFYDCSKDEKLTLFLSDRLPKDKPCRIYTPTAIDLLFSKENYLILLKYEEKMQQVSMNLKLSLKRLESDDGFMQLIDPNAMNIIKNLSLSKHEANPELTCFDDVWNDIKNLFDQSMYHSSNGALTSTITDKLKKVIKVFIDAGIPFVNGRKLAIWSTRFARDEAVKFCKLNNAVTDGMAQEYLRNILLGWSDGKLNVFFDLVKTPEPMFPAMSTVFWSAMSDLFINQMQVGDEVHLFFQDSVAVNNFCWNIELPAIRNKRGIIILHQYNPFTHAWSKPVNMDAPESNTIFLRRRSPHLFDLQNPRLNPSQIKIEGGKPIWKQEFMDNDFTQAFTQWHAPKVITLGKMKSIIYKWKAISTQSKEKYVLFPVKPLTKAEKNAVSKINNNFVTLKRA